MLRERMTMLVILLTSMLFTMTVYAVKPDPRVVGGSDASILDVPWQAFIRIGNNYCGGVVIADLWILTAAHCLDTSGKDGDFSLAPASSVLVYTGTAKIFGVDFTNYISEVSAVHAHSSYNNNTLENDIALIKLSKRVHNKASSVVIADSIVQAQVDATGNQSANDLLLTGWGFTDINRTMSTNTLQKARLSTINDSSCSIAWGETVSGVNNYQNKFFCAQNVGVGACNGDSGGPLIWYDPSRAGDTDGGVTLVGIVSFGVGSQCALDTYPDVYTQVSNYTSWIKNCQAGSCELSISNVSVTEPTDSSGGGSTSILAMTFLFFFSVFRRVLLLYKHEK